MFDIVFQSAELIDSAPFYSRADHDDFCRKMSLALNILLSYNLCLFKDPEPWGHRDVCLSEQYVNASVFGLLHRVREVKNETNQQ